MNKKVNLPIIAVILIVIIAIAFGYLVANFIKSNGDKTTIDVDRQTVLTEKEADDLIHYLYQEAESLFHNTMYEKINSEYCLSGPKIDINIPTIGENVSFCLYKDFNDDWIKRIFVDGVTIDDFYKYIDKNGNNQFDEDVSYADDKIYYTKDNGKYYFDAQCRRTGTDYYIKDFNVVNIQYDKMAFKYKIYYADESNNEIAIDKDFDFEVVKVGDNWKIKTATLPNIGRCGDFLTISK